MTNLERLEKDIREKLPRLNIKEPRIIGSNTFWLDPQILLSDVMEWICIVKAIEGRFDTEPLYIDSGGNLFKIRDNDFWYEEYWDLSKPYLKEQSEDLIDYLATLI